MAVQVFKFGKHLIGAEQTFLVTSLSYAFTNKMPVLPGHVLVAPQRLVPRFADLNADEVSDMFCCVHRIAPVLERVFNASSLTIVVQDGVDAGQTVQHVHVHMLPRQPGDFQRNDDIYDELQKHDKEPTEQTGLDQVSTGFRTLEEMNAEANMLSLHFK